MNCLRCGRETKDDHVFCDDCLQSMEKYPVRPGTAVILPRNKETAASRKSKRHTPQVTADQIRKLKKQRFILFILVVLLTLVLISAAAAFLYVRKDQPLKPGQNYVVVETTAPQ